MKHKTFEERYKDEVFTDNTAIKKYEQCKNCMFRNIIINGEVIDDYKRCECKIFEYPEHKPSEVCDGSANCEYYEKQK